MNILIMGAPGAGKGTQAGLIVCDFEIPYISTGDAFRLAMQQETEMGVQAKQYVTQGLLVPDDITVGIVRERLALPDCVNGFLLDGFPRTIVQAEILDEIMAAMEKKIDHVINLDVDRQYLLPRLSGRRICKSCGATYHVLFNPSKTEGVCDKCGGALYQRSDDMEEKIKTRLEEYANKTAPLLTYYESKGLLRQVNGEQDILQVTNDINTVLRGQVQ